MKVAVVGGGPGGGAAALALAKGGADVTLYRPERPGEKPCGGAVPELVLPRLEGFAPDALPAVRSPRAVLENGHGRRVGVALDALRIFRRRDLDGALVAAAEAAGAIVHGEKVERLEPLAGGAEVTAGGVAARYDWVVGADGARGLTRRRLGLAPQGESLGLGGSLSGLETERLVLAFPALGDAYLWVFPRPGGASVGIAYTPGRLAEADAHAALDRFLDRHLPVAAQAGGWRRLPGPRYRYPIPVFGPWTLPAVRRALRHHILLVGDAAALADPLTREGIRYGFLSGLWAAESLLRGQPGRYADRLACELGEEMERAAQARTLFFDTLVGQIMVPLARAHRGVRQVLADLLSCRQPYRGLTNRVLRASVEV